MSTEQAISPATVSKSTPRKRKAKSPTKALVIAAACSIAALAVILSHDPTLISWNKISVAQGNGILRFCNLLTTIFRHPMQSK